MPARITLKNSDDIVAIGQYTTVVRHIHNAHADGGNKFVEFETGDKEPRITVPTSDIVRVDEIKS